MTAAVHDHKRGYPMRAFAGRTGVFVQRHGDWVRPLHVWPYRGAWRVLCWPCMTPVQSDDDLYDGGWQTQEAAFEAALAHCRDCVAPERSAGAVCNNCNKVYGKAASR